MKLLKRLKEHKVLTLIALIHWAISFVTDKIFFDYVYWDLSGAVGIAKTAITYGVKLVFLIFLLVLYQGIYWFIFEADKSFKRYSLIYLCINMLLLVLTWPGIWRMDEFGILNSASLLLPVFWQNYLTSAFYILSIMLIPVPTGVIIVQIVCISLLAGSVVKMSVKRFGPIGLISFIPLFFFPVLDSNLYPMRMSLYAFLELWLIARLITGEIRDRGQAYTLCLAAALVTVWRTEAAYYLVLFPVALYLVVKEKELLRRALIVFLALTIPLFTVQSIGDKLTSSHQYDLTSVMLPLVPLTEASSVSADETELAAINKVVPVDLILETAEEGKSGINLFWSDLYDKTDYSDEEYAAFKKAYYSLIKKYPDVFLKERWECFISSNDLLQNTTEIYDPDADQVPNYVSFRSYPGTASFAPSLRSNVIRFLELRDKHDYDQKKAGYAFVYGALFSIVLLICIFIAEIIKKHKLLIIASMLALGRVPLVFMTAPSRLFMYYYSVYLIGMMALSVIIIKGIMKLDGRFGGVINKTLVYAGRNGIGKTVEEIKERLNKTETDELTVKAAAYKGVKEWGDPDGKHECENGPFISIVVPAYDPDRKFFEELLDSVTGQTYDNYELIIADGGASEDDKNLKETVEKYAEKHNIKNKFNYLPLEKNDGISANTNAGIEVAKGDYIALLDHDDLLTHDALVIMAEHIKTSDIKPIFLYSDEDKCDDTASTFFEPNFKPDFDKELLLSNNYICHFLLIRKDAADACPLRSGFDGAQDYDLILRLMRFAENEKCGIIMHIPFVLYHWRTHKASTASNTASKEYAYEAGKRALEDYYEESGLKDKVKVTHSRHLGFYNTEYIPDILSVRDDIAGTCGRIIENGIVTGGPKRFIGLKQNAGGYLHRARLRAEIGDKDYDVRALRLREEAEDKEAALTGLLKEGKKLVYDPEFTVEI